MLTRNPRAGYLGCCAALAAGAALRWSAPLVAGGVGLGAGDVLAGGGGEAADIAPETYTFDAFVSSYGVPRGPIEGKLSVPFELQPAAAGVWADAA